MTGVWVTAKSIISTASITTWLMYGVNGLSPAFFLLPFSVYTMNTGDWTEQKKLPFFHRLFVLSNTIRVVTYIDTNEWTNVHKRQEKLFFSPFIEIIIIVNIHKKGVNHTIRSLFVLSAHTHTHTHRPSFVRASHWQFECAKYKAKQTHRTQICI